MQSRHESKIFMFKVAQRQHGGSFLGIAWDPRNLWFDNFATGTDGRVIFYYQEYLSIWNWTGFRGGQFNMGRTEILQYLIDLLISGLQKISCVSTLRDNIVRIRCSTSFRLVWDPGVIHNFSWALPDVWVVVLALLEDNKFWEGSIAMSLSK